MKDQQESVHKQNREEERLMSSKRMAVPLALGSLTVLLAIAGPAFATHIGASSDRGPTGATPMRLSVVPAFRACTAQDSDHAVGAGGTSTRDTDPEVDSCGSTTPASS